MTTHKCLSVSISTILSSLKMIFKHGCKFDNSQKLRFRCSYDLMCLSKEGKILKKKKSKKSFIFFYFFSFDHHHLLSKNNSNALETNSGLYSCTLSWKDNYEMFSLGRIQVQRKFVIGLCDVTIVDSTISLVVVTSDAQHHIEGSYFL